MIPVDLEHYVACPDTHVCVFSTYFPLISLPSHIPVIVVTCVRETMCQVENDQKVLCTAEGKRGYPAVNAYII